MFLIRWALQNSFVVLAITLGLVFLGGAVVPGIPTTFFQTLRLQ